MSKFAIDICVDHVWSGSGRVIDGSIVDCAAQFCDDYDASLSIYDDIEDAISEGNDSLQADLDGESKTITWSLTPIID